MSEFPLRDGAQVKSLWRAAAIVLAVVFGPAMVAYLALLLRH